MNFLDIFGSIVVTEKASRFVDSESGFVFYAASPSVSKDQVKRSVESFFKGVKVSSVRCINVKPKTRRFKGRVGVTKKRKKFIVSFSQGRVDLMSGSLSGGPR